MTPEPERIALVDAPESAGRTTATLVGSLTARVAALHVISGADAIGSLMAGYAEIGREVAKTAEGARLRRAIERGRPGLNGDLIWRRLRFDDWASSLRPTPVLDQLRNDVALLLADDLEVTLDRLPIPGELAPGSEPFAERTTFIDFVLGLWAFSVELVRAVDALAAPTLEAPGAVVRTEEPEPETDPGLLR